MGVSSDGQLCYGYLFEDDHEFPWYTEDDFGDVDQWWQEINGYEELPLEKEPFTPDGYYQNWFRKLGKLEQEKILTPRWDHHRKWQEEHPIPFDLVNYCSDDYPMYIVAVPSTVLTASRRYPELVNSFPKIKGISDFYSCLKEHGIHECNVQPNWYLSGYMG